MAWPEVLNSCSSYGVMYPSSSSHSASHMVDILCKATSLAASSHAYHMLYDASADRLLKLQQIYFLSE